MSKDKKKKSTSGGTIALNKKARHDYLIVDKYEAGLSLMGWEVKSMRAGKLQLIDSYVIFKDAEAFLIGAHITPLNTASTHVIAEPSRTRKLLLNRKEIDKLERNVHQSGFTAVCLAVYWKGNKIKAEIALAKGKQDHDKRAAEKDKEWSRDKLRIVKAYNR